MIVNLHSEQLGELRKELTDLDTEIIALVAKRIDLAKKIGKLKKELNLECYQPQRYQSVVTFYETSGAERGLDSSFTILLADVLHNESLRIQNQIRKDDE